MFLLFTKLAFRIAAGEVVQKPSAALKELLENSIDAGSTQITISVKDGGLSFLQIQDNGHGIRKEDMPIVCERFTTSKLRDFEDLKTIQTFGFRGEALASISFVSYVTITSKISSSSCAFRGKYCDGKLIPAKPGESADAKPCAGLNGTTITVEDMFYNMPTRKAAFKNISEQYQKILDVVTKYGVHFSNRKIGFVCKKLKQSTPDVVTSCDSNLLDTIRHCYGSSVASELMNMEFSHDEKDIHFTVHGLISNGNFSNKKNVLILFINDRLVESSNIRRIVDSCYSEVLPRGSHPFVYLSIVVPPHHVDVNIHPTKREVRFLHEDVLLEYLFENIKEKLSSANESRCFGTQKLLTTSFLGDVDSSTSQISVDMENYSSRSPQDVNLDDPDYHDLSDSVVSSQEVNIDSRYNAAESSQNRNLVLNNSNSSSSFESSKKRKLPPNKFVRTDPSLIKIDSFFSLERMSSSSSSKSVSECESARIPSYSEDRISEEDNQCFCKPVNDDPQNKFTPSKCPCCCQSYSRINDSKANDKIEPLLKSRYDDFEDSNCDYDSIQSLRKDIYTNTSSELLEILKKHIFVGVVDEFHVLIQYDTKLLVLHFQILLQYLFFQLVIRKFGEMPSIVLRNPVNIYQYVRQLLDNEIIWKNNLQYSKEEVASRVSMLLMSKSEMLYEYFSIKIDENGNLCQLPQILPGYLPCPEELPRFLLRLATETDWNDEFQCFFDISTEISRYYSLWFKQYSGLDATAVNLLQALKSYLIPNKSMHIEGVIVQIACLNDLYKVFERC